MSQSRRNILVGLTVMGALLALGWMMLRYGSTPVAMFRSTPQLQVHFVGDRADGLAEGSQVTYRGVAVGSILHLRRDANQRDVIIDAQVDSKPPLPGNVQGLVRTQSLISGQAALSLELTSPTPEGTLEEGQTLAARFVGSELIPPSFGDLASELEKTTHDLRDAKLIAHLDETVRDAGEVMKSLQEYVGNPKTREDVTSAIASLRQTMDSANRAAANVEQFSEKLPAISDQASQTIAKTQADVDRLTNRLDERLMQTSKLLDSMQSIAAKVDTGQGTAGQFLNDPKLYQSLVESSRQLNATIMDLRRLIEQWEQEGVSFKLK